MIDGISDGEAYASDTTESIWTAGIDHPNHAKFGHWSSRIECHGATKEEAEELRDFVLEASKTARRLALAAG